MADERGLTDPLWIKGRELSFLIIEDDEAADEVLQLTRQAGVRVVKSIDEARTLVKG